MIRHKYEKNCINLFHRRFPYKRYSLIEDGKNDLYNLQFISVSGKSLFLSLRKEGARYNIDLMKRQLEFAAFIKNRNCEYVFIYSLKQFDALINKFTLLGFDKIEDEANKSIDYVKRMVDLVDGYYKVVILSP